MQDEYLFICDEHDHPIDKRVLRSEIHRDLNFWHRTTGICLRNAQGEILCHQRSFEKDENPGVWSFVNGGHVVYGEDVMHCALKEMEEELGLVLHADQLHFLFVLANPDLKHHSYRYLVNYSPEMGEISMKDGEVIALEWISLEKLIDADFTQDRFRRPIGREMYDALKL